MQVRRRDRSTKMWPSRVAKVSSEQPPPEWAVTPYFDVTGKVLMGLINAPSAEAALRPNHLSQIDVEIHGRNPKDRADSALSTVATLLPALAELRSYAELHAPKDWQAHYRTASDYAGLFLEGFEFHDDGLIRVLFDFGHLELLILDLHSDGERTVSVEP